MQQEQHCEMDEFAKEKSQLQTRLWKLLCLPWSLFLCRLVLVRLDCLDLRRDRRGL